jgi:hypothetical protein
MQISIAVLKEMGGLALMVSVMLYLAARDPERNVAIIDAVSMGLCIVAITPLVSLYTLVVGRGELYAGHLIWGRSFVRLVSAGWNPLLFAAEKDTLEICGELLKNAREAGK